MTRALPALAVLLLGAAGCASPIHRAIANGDMPALERALSSGADLNAAHGRIEPVAYACIHENFDALKLLVEKGARLNGFFTSPISMCAYHGRLDMVEFLVEHGEVVLDDDVTGTENHPDIRRFLSEARGRQSGAAAPAPPSPPAAGAPIAATTRSSVDFPTQKAPARLDDFALVIGIEKYSRLPEARYAERDADAVKRHLLALGYPERNIILLEGEQATRGALQGYVEEWLPRNVRPASEVFVYFSGHGSPDPKDGDAYLVPWDGDAKFLKSTAYPLKSLYSSLGKLKAKRVLVALDSCFSGAGGRSVLASGARPLVSHVDDTEAPAGVTVLSAASGDEITATLDDEGHGAFTYYLLKALNDGKRTARAAYVELKPLVQDEAHRQNREQTPLMLGVDAPF